jgi:hypothetical protein
MAKDFGALSNRTVEAEAFQMYNQNLGHPLHCQLLYRTAVFPALVAVILIVGIKLLSCDPFVS